MKFRSAPTVFSLAAGSALVLLLAVALAVWAGDRDVPPTFRYVLPHARAYIVTGPLDDVWRNVPGHFSRVFTAAASLEGQEFSHDFKRTLREHCMVMDDISDAGKLGLDGSQGAAFSFDPAAERSQPPRFMVALPVADAAKLELTLKRMVVELKIELRPPARSSSPEQSAPDEMRVATAIVIDRNGSSGVVFCDANGESVDLAAGTVIPLSDPETPVSYSLSPVAAASAVGIGCSVQYSDGSTSACECSFRNRDCPEAPQEISFPVTEAHLDGRPARGVRLDREVSLFFVGRTAILTRDAGAAEQAVRPAENARFFRGDDTFLAVQRHLREIAGPGDGVIAGAIMRSWLPVSGYVHFGLALAPQRVTGRVLLPWNSFRLSLLDRVAMPAAPTADENLLMLSDDGELRINDPWLGHYLRFLENYSGDTRRQLRKLGNLMIFLHEIMGLDEVGTFRFAIRGVREGVPDLVMSLDLPPEDAEVLLKRLRERMRVARDREILAAAAGEFRKVNNRNPEQIEEVIPLLGQEFGALWQRYRFGDPPDDDGSPLAPDSVYVEVGPAGFAPGDFVSPDYEFNRDGHFIRLVPPPFGDNDFRFRVALDRQGAVDAVQLRSGRFRMAAFVDTERRRLVVASDVDTLLDTLKVAPVAHEQAPQSSKATLIGDPEFLVNQGLQYPDGEISEFFQRYLLDFEQYRGMQARFDVRPDRQGISATVVLSHD